MKFVFSICILSSKVTMLLEYKNNWDKQISNCSSGRSCERVASRYNIWKSVSNTLWLDKTSVLSSLCYGGQSWRRGTNCDCKIDRSRVPSPFEEMKYLFKFIFSFLRSGVETKRRVEFRHSTHNASRIHQKVGTLSSLCVSMKYSIFVKAPLNFIWCRHRTQQPHRSFIIFNQPSEEGGYQFDCFFLCATSELSAGWNNFDESCFYLKGSASCVDPI